MSITTALKLIWFYFTFQSQTACASAQGHELHVIGFIHVKWMCVHSLSYGIYQLNKMYIMNCSSPWYWLYILMKHKLNLCFPHGIDQLSKLCFINHTFLHWCPHILSKHKLNVRFALCLPVEWSYPYESLTITLVTQHLVELQIECKFCLAYWTCTIHSPSDISL